MRSAADTSIEHWLDALATAIFTAAVSFALAKLAPGLGLGIVVASLLAFAGCWVSLHRIPADSRLPLPKFDLVHPAFEDHAEDEEIEALILTEEDIFALPADELLLDDVLEEPGSDSRVVRLFAPGQLPTPGELKASIDRHLHARGHPTAIPDASEALSEALDQLRRSLR